MWCHLVWRAPCALFLVAISGCAGAVDRFDADYRAAVGAETLIEFKAAAEPADVAENASRLSLEEAVRLSLVHDPRIQAAGARLRGALADAGQARLLPNPVLSVAVRWPEDGGSSVIEAGLGADLLALLQTSGRVSAADNRLRAASAQTLAVVLDVIAETEETYVAVQTADGQLKTIRERRELLSRLLKLAQAKTSAGEGVPADALAVQAQQAALDVELLRIESESRDARLALATLIGNPSGASLWTLQPWTPPPLKQSDETAWISAALKHRPEVQAARWELAALGDEAGLAAGGFLDGAEVGVDAEREGDWEVGPAVSIPLPLLDWGQARREKARAAVIEARHQLTHAQRQTIEDIRRAFSAMLTARKALDRTQNELLPILLKRRDQTEAAFKNGMMDSTALILAEQELLEGQSAMAELRKGHDDAFIRLRRAVGGRGIAAAMQGTLPNSQSESQ